MHLGRPIGSVVDKVVGTGGLARRLPRQPEEGADVMGSQDRRIWYVIGVIVIVLILVWLFWPGASVPTGTPTTDTAPTTTPAPAPAQ